MHQCINTKNIDYYVEANVNININHRIDKTKSRVPHTCFKVEKIFLNKTS